MVREKIIISILFTVIIVLYITQITLTMFINQYDEENYQARLQINEWETQNMLLEYQVLNQESYITIASEAAKMGYYYKPR